MESILTSIKKLLSITEDCTDFDPDVIMHINAVFDDLKQIGVGPPEGFYIENKETTWDEYIADPTKYQRVKSYMYAKVRLMFDPPQNSAHLTALKEQVAEYEWRLNFDAENSSATTS